MGKPSPPHGYATWPAECVGEVIKRFACRAGRGLLFGIAYGRQMVHAYHVAAVDRHEPNT